MTELKTFYVMHFVFQVFAVEIFLLKWTHLKIS